MARKLAFIPLVMLVLAIMACSFTLNLPITEIKTGPTVTDDISVPLPSNTTAVKDLNLVFGAGQMTLNPDGQDALVSGTATYNVTDFKPQITETGNEVRIQQGNVDLKGIPNIGANVINEWDLTIGTTPINFRMTAGAYQGHLELGGLDIRSLHITDGASENNLRFSKQNLGEMSSLRYETGASKVTLTGLANANFTNMIFKSGAGDYTLDFTGELQQDASVDIQSGLSNLVIVMPQGTPTNLNVRGGLTNVNFSGVWSSSGNTYTIEGNGPSLTINIDMGAGNLELRNP
jgi:hypothetical protein